MDVSDYFAAYTAMQPVASRLLMHAQAENWDTFTAELPDYVFHMSQLPVVEWSRLTVIQQQHLAEVLKELKALQDELILHAEARKMVLGGELQSLHNADKLGKVYR